MLRIAKLRVGAEAYQLSGVAQGLDDYYTGRGESPGEWHGHGAERLGLDGEVAADDLRAVLAGLAPGTGGLTPNGTPLRAHVQRVPGFDLCFKVPKSASVLYAVSDDPGVQGAVVEAGDAALTATLGWVEQHAARVRRGSHNRQWQEKQRAKGVPEAELEGRTLPAEGLTFAVFRHRTSRAGDPLLHWHCLTANLAEGPDGQWGAIVHPELYRTHRAAGEVFQSVFRAELTARLGVEWRPGRHVPEIAGMPKSLLDMFSKRRAEIEAYLDASGGPRDAAGQERAALATRRGKSEHEGERFDDGWKAEAIAAGWGPAQAAELLANSQGAAVADVDEVWRLGEDWIDDAGVARRWDRIASPDEWVADLARRDLTATRSTFDRHEIAQAVAARLGAGASIDTIERVVARAVASPALVAVDDNGERRWTSRELVDIEARYLDRIASGRDRRSAASPAFVDQLIARRATLGYDQELAVRRLTGSTDGLRVLLGPAGTGKTFTLDAVRDVLEGDGKWVIGAAPSAKAAIELTAGAGIDAATIQRRLAQLDTGELTFEGGAVLVVDEAGMAGIRDLERLCTAAIDAGATVILAGDHRQLPEVTAGGGFAGAVEHAGTVVELSENRRQHELWEQTALAQLRSGNVAHAVDAYRIHDRVVVATDHASLVNAAVDHWDQLRLQGLNVVLIAGTVEMTSSINREVRDRLVDAGELPVPTVNYGGRDYSIGERVVLRRNSRYERTTHGAQLAVVNGDAGEIIDGGNGQLHVRLDRGDHDVHLGASYLERGEVDHGYAITVHRGQGGTWDAAIGVGLDGLYRELAYTLMSRGRLGNWLHVTGTELAAVDQELARHSTGLPLPGEERDIDEELHDRIRRSRAKQMALTVDPDALAVARLAGTENVAGLRDRAVYCRRIERLAEQQTGVSVDAIETSWVRSQHTAAHVTIGARVKAFDRRNIGTVSNFDDVTLSAIVQFVSEEGREAWRTLDYGVLEVLEPSPRVLPQAASDALARRRARIDEVLAGYREILATHGVGYREARHLARAVDVIVDRAAEQLGSERPSWLTDMIGHRPSDLVGCRLWDDAVRTVADWRATRQLAGDTPGLGPEPAEPVDSMPWGQINVQLAASRTWLATRDAEVAPASLRRRTRAQLQARLVELDDLFATAPPDHRDLIARLTGDQAALPITELADALTIAAASQDERRRWILTHWPHVVEAAEVHRQLDHVGGPDLYDLIDQLPAAAAAAGVAADTDWVNDPPTWVCAALGQIAGDYGVDVDAARLLARIAAYRDQHHVTSADPLGPEPLDLDHATHRDRLAREVEQHTTRPKSTQVHRTTPDRLDVGR